MPRGKPAIPKPKTVPVKLTEHEIMELMVDLIETKKIYMADDDRRERIDGILAKIDVGIAKIRLDEKR